MTSINSDIISWILIILWKNQLTKLIQILIIGYKYHEQIQIMFDLLLPLIIKQFLRLVCLIFFILVLICSRYNMHCFLYFSIYLLLIYLTLSLLHQILVQYIFNLSKSHLFALILYWIHQQTILVKILKDQIHEVGTKLLLVWIAIDMLGWWMNI